MITSNIDRFLKCDLHVHSSTCYSRHYTKKDFFDKIKSSDLDVISITDHNIIDVKLYKELLEDDTFKKKLIAGIELNVKLSNETIAKNNLTIKGDYFHAVLWFDVTKIDGVWSLLKSLIKENITDLRDIDNLSETEISIKMEGKAIDLEKIQETLSNEDYYFIFHENKGERNLSDYLQNGIDSNEKFKQKLFYYNNSLAVEGGKKSRYISDYFKENLNVIVSSFLFSDAIKIKDIGSRYTWINYNGEFKNLILPLSDSETRVFTSDLCPENPQKNKNNFLEAIKFDIKNRPLENSDVNHEIKETKTIYFSPGLNGIIGSRGSGKTMLGCILVNKDVNNYIEYIDIDSIEYKLKDSEFTKNVPKCKYLKQNSLLNIYSQENFEELDFIEEYYSELLKKKKEIISLTIQEITEKIGVEKKSILKFYDEYKGNIVFWDFLKNEVSNKNLLIKLENSDFSNNFDELKSVEQNIAKTDLTLKVLLESFESLNFSNDYPESDEFFKLLIDYKNKNISAINEIKNNNVIFNKSIMDYDNIKFKLRNKFINTLVDLIKTENSEIDNESTIYQSNLEQLNMFFSDLFKLRFSLKNSYDNILEKYNKIYEDNIDRELPLNHEDTITISTTLKEKKEYLDIIKEQLKIENRDYSDYFIKILFNANDYEIFKTYFIGTKYRNIDKFGEYINRYYANILSSLDEIKNISLKIAHNGKALEKYSPGKRSEILLDIFLHDNVIESDQYKYIVLDQPEDNLDTNTVIIKLVEKIRKMKLDKQFFIISHSAPVIINADSDIIICSKEMVNAIDYASGSINDSSLKEDIVTILDGGEKNLKMRLNKYDFKYEEE